MSRFNAVKERTKTTNYEGGEAYRESDELGLISLLVTSMLTDKFYENSGRVMNRLEEYWNSLKVTPAGREYFMKAACYTRDLFKLRSVSHLCAALVGEGVVKDLFQPEEKAMVRRFFSKVVMRPDDITEIISAYKGRLGSYVSKRELYNYLQ